MSKDFVIEKEWTTKAGLKAVVYFVHDSHRCGYVLVPEKHPLYEKDYNYHLEKEKWDELEKRKTEFRGSPVDILCASMDRTDNNGPALSYFLEVHGGITFAGKLRGQDGWWFGFDCAHLGDKTKYSNHPGEVLRSLRYCEDECEGLASQIASLGELLK